MGTLPGVTASGDFEDFVALYERGQALVTLTVSGQTLLHLALGNTAPRARVAIAEYLLEDGADAAAIVKPERFTTVHVLFGHNSHDFAAEARLLKRLLKGGADINAVAGRGVGTPLQYLSSFGKFSDDAFAPFYDVLFEQPNLDLLKEGASGRSTLESAKLLGRRRQALVRRMEEYLSGRDHRAEV